MRTRGGMDRLRGNGSTGIDPVFDIEAFDAAKLSHIGGNERQPSRPRLTGKQKILGADGRAGRL
jgi:hypothetical protein